MTGRRALVVGIDDYPFGPLGGCVNDARAIGQLLARHADGSPNFDVRTLVGPPENVTRSRLREAVQELFATPAEMCLFYFAGHGSENQLGGYLVTVDADRYDEGLAMRDVIELANQQEHAEATLILDCCHAGHLGSAPPGSNSSIELREGVSVLTAARNTQTAAETDGQGLFTSLLCQGLEGGAADVLGEVTAASMYAFADSLLGAWQQRPLFKSHVATLSPIRMAETAVAPGDLRELPAIFASAEADYGLTPRHEQSEENFDPELNRVFAALQRMRAARLVEPVGFAHMYDAAMQGASCRLTALGRRYWHLAQANQL